MTNGVPWIKFGKDDRKIEVDRLPHHLVAAGSCARVWRQSQASV